MVRHVGWMARSSSDTRLWQSRLRTARLHADSGATVWLSGYRGSPGEFFIVDTGGLRLRVDLQNGEIHFSGSTDPVIGLKLQSVNMPLSTLKSFLLVSTMYNVNPDRKVSNAQAARPQAGAR